MNTDNMKIQPDKKAMQQRISALIAERMKRDHLDMEHKSPDMPAIVVTHFQRTAEAIIFTQLEQFLDSDKPEDRERAVQMMQQRYLAARQTAHKYGLVREFANSQRLDQAADVAKSYLQAINGTDMPEHISYKTASRKTMTGQQVMEYFISDIMTGAYEYVFEQLGIDTPKQPTSRRRSA